MAGDNRDPRRNPQLAARNRRTAIILALVAVLVYAVYVLNFLK